mmetsp:Transcript_20114/g.43675  ORF Transcript_20114/g.43675 Transcript_20114/m.43675 type:complete len:85 (+) Transcript_20114:1973-2227(+)
MHCNYEWMVGNFTQNVPLCQNVFNVGAFSSDESFGDDFHGKNIGGVSVSHLENFPECSHPYNFQQFEVFGSDELSICLTFRLFV